MIEYPFTPENFQPAFNQVLNSFAHVKFRDKSGRSAILMHEDEFNAIIGAEPSERQKEILAARYKEEGSVTFKNIDEMYQYFGIQNRSE